jgi:hypothetical protein
MGKILFLSAMAFMAYRYITRTNRKAQQITEAQGTVQILPPERTENLLPAGRAVEALPEAKSAPRISGAVETDLRAH